MGKQEEEPLKVRLENVDKLSNLDKLKHIANGMSQLKDETLFEVLRQAIDFMENPLGLVSGDDFFVWNSDEEDQIPRIFSHCIEDLWFDSEGGQWEYASVEITKLPDITKSVLDKLIDSFGKKLILDYVFQDVNSENRE